MDLKLAQVKQDKRIKTFIWQTDKYLDALGYTDHGGRHINIVAERARSLAKKIGLNQQDQELAAIAGYCHDMGNFLGRDQHHYWAALLFSQCYLRDYEPLAVSTVAQAIVSHDKYDLKIVNKVTAVLILADKSDVHRSRVREKNRRRLKEDIHDRVNYSVISNDLLVRLAKKEIILKLKVDTKITDPLEYFEIFIDRMSFCRLAAEYLGYQFVLMINNFKLS
ncbi:MAG TPA: HD domain-containing protein [bacterium]|nr:HD domain-containing protein [bacterium]HNZ73064.1 HD domain-containing protein [bacterium]HOH67161.1 HD domain-containing protein [bacterium]HQA63791.1 HD domain-containing protein [bacterium]